MVLQRLVQVQLASRTNSGGGGGQGHSPAEIVAHLARRVDDIKHPKARACVVWLVGQYAGVGVDVGMAGFAPDVLRKLAKTFVGESRLVKLQVVTLAGKLVVLCRDGGDGVEEKVGVLARYVFSLARYDKDWDVRDRGRFVGGLVGGFIGRGGSEGVLKDRVGVVLRREQVKVVLFEGKKVGKDFGKGEDEEIVGDVGSFGRVRRGGGVSYFGEEVLPDWLERGVESVLRDGEEGEGGGNVRLPLVQGQEKVVLVPMGVNGSGGSTPAGSLKMDLDAFYKDAKEDSGEEDYDDEDDDDDDEEEEEEEGEEGEDEEDEDKVEDEELELENIDR